MKADTAPGSPAAGRPPRRIDGAGGTVLWVEPAYEAAARALGLLDRHGLAGAMQGAERGAAGRGATAVLPLPGHGERLHLRPLRRGGWLGPLLGDRIWRIARPLGELSCTKRLHEAGAPVARPVLVSARRSRGCWRAAVGTVYQEESVDAAAFLRGDALPGDRAAAARAAGRAIRRFHDLGGRHRDLHAGNLLVRGSGREYQVWVVDLDRARLSRRVSVRRRGAELTRLARSLYKQGLFDRVGPRGCASLLAGYSQGDRALRRRLARRLRRGRWSVALHRLGYRLRRNPAASREEPHPRKTA